MGVQLFTEQFLSKDVPSGAVRGTTGLKQNAGHIQEEWLRSLQGPKGIKAYCEMRDNSPIVGGWHRAHVYTTTRVPWRTRPSRQKRSALKAAKLWEDILKSMDHTWKDFMIEAGQVPVFGWGFFETVPKRLPNGQWGIAKISYRAPETLARWEIDASGDIKGMWQRRADFTEVFLPISRGLLLRTDTSKNNPEGRSWLRNCYDPWYRVKHLADFEGIFAERISGVPFAKIPMRAMVKSASAELKDLRTYAENLVRGIRLDEQMGIVFPSDEEFDFKFLHPQQNFNFDQAIRRWELRMAMALNAENMFTGVESGATRGVSKGKDSLTILTQNSLLDQFQETINKFLVQPLMAINKIDPEDVPFYEHTGVSPTDLAAVSEYLSPLLRYSAVVPTEELEDKLLGLVEEAQGVDLKNTKPSDTLVERTPEFDARRAKVAGGTTEAAGILPILESAAAGRLPPETAKELLQLSFGLSSERANELLAPIEKALKEKGPVEAPAEAVGNDLDISSAKTPVPGGVPTPDQLDADSDRKTVGGNNPERSPDNEK